MKPEPHPRWMSVVLVCAAVYNIAWGAFVSLFPHLLFRWAEMDPPRYPELWQCIGMMVGVFGVGYALAARDPLGLWPIVFVGLLGKILGPIGFVLSASRDSLPWIAGVTIVTNDVIWWVPFGAILYAAYRRGREGKG